MCRAFGGAEHHPCAGCGEYLPQQLQAGHMAMRGSCCHGAAQEVGARGGNAEGLSGWGLYGV